VAKKAKSGNARQKAIKKTRKSIKRVNKSLRRALRRAQRRVGTDGKQARSDDHVTQRIEAAIHELESALGRAKKDVLKAVRN
jgi:hypothetical protein